MIERFWNHRTNSAPRWWCVLVLTRPAGNIQLGRRQRLIAPRSRAWLLAAFISIVSACGGDSRAPAQSVSEPPPSFVPATVSAVPPAEATVSAPVPWTAARFFDDERRFAAELSNPVCFVLQARDGDYIVVEPSNRGASIQVMTPGENRYVVSLDDSPYGPRGCATDQSFSLELSVVTPSRQTPTATVIVACSPGDSPTVCPPGIGREGRLQRTTGGNGRLCLSWPGRPADEAAYRVEITYGRISRVFAYLLPGSATAFLVPAEAGPRLSESVERCLERKDVSVSLIALALDGSALGGDSFSIVAECRG